MDQKTAQEFKTINNNIGKLEIKQSNMESAIKELEENNAQRLMQEREREEKE